MCTFGTVSVTVTVLQVGWRGHARPPLINGSYSLEFWTKGKTEGRPTVWEEEVGRKKDKGALGREILVSNSHA